MNFNDILKGFNLNTGSDKDVEKRKVITFTQEEYIIVDMLNSESGKIFMKWLANNTIHERKESGYVDGLKSALEIYRLLGRDDVYRKIEKLIQNIWKIKEMTQQ